LLEEMLAELCSAGQLDGLLVAPHGATVSQPHPDADGAWLSMVREAVGPDCPIIGTIDPHANLSRKMVSACDALIAYRTNPHIDQRQRGLEAAQLMSQMLSDNVRPTMAVESPPMVIGIECQCHDEEPCSTLHSIADEIRDHSGVLSVSIVLGFPYADVEEMGSSVIVITDDDKDMASTHSRRLANEMWSRRASSTRQLVDVDAAVEDALKLKQPVCLLDTGDNVGGGSPGDGTWIAHILRDKRIDRSLVCLHDAKAVAAACEAGPGATVSLQIGGHSGPLNGEPLEDQFTVVSIHDGHFTENKPMHGGFDTFDQGRTAVLTTSSGLTVIATSKRMTPFSLGQIISCELDPATFRILVAKGVNAPIAAYQQVCEDFVRVGTPGYTSADMTSQEYVRRRRPMFPFEPDVEWNTGDTHGF